jgi:hypothetical protein
MRGGWLLAAARLDGNKQDRALVFALLALRGGPCKHLYERNVGAAPLQHHPTVAVVLVYVSVQITAASANLTDPISPLPLRPKSSAMKEISRFIGLSAPVHLFLFTSSSNSRGAEMPCP